MVCGQSGQNFDNARPKVQKKYHEIFFLFIYHCVNENNVPSVIQQRRKFHLQAHSHSLNALALQ